MIKISVIVPVYNDASYLKTSLGSIVNQTVRPFELIIVNDGSTDESSAICNEFSERYSFVKVIYQSNKGVTKARETGVENSHGDWICFVDADDSLPIDALECFISGINDDVDIVIGELTELRTKELLSIDSYRQRLIKGIITAGPYAKLFRKTIFSSFIFDIPREVRFGEDFLMNIRLSFATKRNVAFIGDVVYYYKLNDDSITSSFKSTINYEEMYHNHLINSIPENRLKEYMDDCIRSRINGWRKLTLKKIFVLKYTNSIFYNNLMKDIKDYDFSLTLFNKMLLSKNPMMRVFMFVYLFYNKLFIHAK